MYAATVQRFVPGASSTATPGIHLESRGRAFGDVSSSVSTVPALQQQQQQQQVSSRIVSTWAPTPASTSADSSAGAAVAAEPQFDVAPEDGAMTQPAVSAGAGAGSGAGARAVAGGGGGVSGGVEHWVMLKGAPEVVLTFCDSYFSSTGGRRPIDDDFTEDFVEIVERLGGSGRRLLAMAHKRIDLPRDATGAGCFQEDAVDDLLHGLCFIGITAIVDPPRPETKGAIEKCRLAGLKVLMVLDFLPRCRVTRHVTGDHPVTAAAIARQVGIFSETSPGLGLATTALSVTMAPTEVPHSTAPRAPAALEYDGHRATSPSRSATVALRDAGKGRGGGDIEFSQLGRFPLDQDVVVLGSEVPTLTDADWTQILAHDTAVFARMTPEHKLMVVKRCQANGHVVAVTGDGVNDAPALRAADIGVAMGKNGSEVAREAAQIVLLDDKFSSIVDGIEIGRNIFDNLKKTVAYTLCHLMPEVLPTFLTLVFGFPLGLTTVQLFPAISLAYEPSEADVMRRPPRRVKTDRLVTPALLGYSYLVAGVIESAMLFLAYWLTFWHHGIPIADLVQSQVTYFQPGAPPFCVGGAVAPATTVTPSPMPVSPLSQPPVPAPVPTPVPHPLANMSFFRSLPLGSNSSFLSKGTGRCFSDDEQVVIAAQACAAAYVTLVVSQFINLFMCRTSRVSLFRHSWANPTTYFGLGFSFTLMCVFTYIPYIQTAFGSLPQPPVTLIALAGSFVLFLTYNETRKAICRHLPPRHWLQSVLSF